MVKKSATGQAADAKVEQTVRNELFGGWGKGEKNKDILINPDKPSSSANGTDGMTVQQLVDEAVTTHKDTTRSANRALKCIEDTKKMQAATMDALETQGQQINQIDDRITAMGSDLSYAEKILVYMRLWCCCQMCCATDPDIVEKKLYEARVRSGKTAKPSGGGAASEGGDAGKTAAGANGKASPQSKPISGAHYKDPTISLGPEHKQVELGLHAETRKQNEVIDQIASGLQDILEGARAMNSELAIQNKQAGNVTAKAEATSDRIDNMNNKSMLKEFKGKGK